MTQASSSSESLDAQFEELRRSLSLWRTTVDKKSPLPIELRKKIGYLFSQGFSRSKLQSVGISYQQAKRWSTQYHALPDENFTFVALSTPTITTEIALPSPLVNLTVCHQTLKAVIECKFEQSKAFGF